MPNSEVFTEHMRALRIRKTDTIICYEVVGMFAVARCAAMFKYFGAENVRIMNGGLKKWLKEGRPVYKGSYMPGDGLEADGDYSYSVDDPDKFIKDISKIHEIAGSIVRGGDSQITDARGPARFNGELTEPAGMRAGHISGSVNLPFSKFVDQETGCLRSDAELREIF